MKFTENIVVVNEGEEYLTKSKAGSHTIIGDEPLDHGGKDEGPTAHQFLLSALGMCIAITLRMYANRKKWDLQKVEIQLNLEKINDIKGESTIIYKNIVLTGQLDEEQKKRLLIISEKCPVHKTLSSPIFIREFNTQSRNDNQKV